jgi:hypothetical protein
VLIPAARRGRDQRPPVSFNRLIRPGFTVIGRERQA